MRYEHPCLISSTEAVLDSLRLTKAAEVVFEKMKLDLSTKFSKVFR